MSTRGVLFTTLLTLVAGALLVQTLRLAPGSRLAPLWVVVPTLALLILKLVLDTTSSLDTKLRTLREDSLFGASQHVDGWRRRHAPDDQPRERPRRELRMTVWGAFLVALVYVLGFLIAVPLYLAPYLHSEADVSWNKALIITALTTGFLYLVFGLLLNVPFPRGLVG